MTARSRKGGKKMGRSATARKLTYGEMVAQRLAHDTNLMASVTQAMKDVSKNKVLTVEEFAQRLDVACVENEVSKIPAAG